MSLQLWLGNAGSGKSYNLFNYITKEAEKHPDYNYLVIVPEQFTLQTQYDLVNMSKTEGIINIDVLSFARLAHRVFEEVGYANGSGLLIDDMGKSLIIRRLASQYENELPILGKHLKKLGYISEIKSVISEFMQYGIGNNEIESFKKAAKASGKGRLNSKLDDIQVLFNAFRKYIDEKYITSEEILDRVSSVVPESKKLKKSIIAFDGFTGFTPVQYKLIEALLVNCVDVHVTVLKDTCSEKKADETDEQNLFYMSYKTITELNKRAKVNSINKKPDVIIGDDIPIRYRLYDGQLDKNGMIRHLEKNLFRDKPSVYECFTDEKHEVKTKFNIFNTQSSKENLYSVDEVDTADEKDTNSIKNIEDVSNIKEHSLVMFSSRNPYDEMKQVAIKINDLVREEGYHYRDIAIVSGDVETYMNSARRVFCNYDIPYFVDKTQPILLNPFIEYIRAIISILAEDFSYEAVFRYLKSTLTDIPMDSIDKLENYVLATGIKGYKKWNTRFVRRKKDMDEDQLEAIDGIRKQVIDIFDKKFISKKTFPVRDIATEIYRLISINNIQSQLYKRSLEYKENGDGAKAKEYDQIYAHVMDLMDKIVELLGDEEVTVQEFGELMDAGFDEIRIGVIPSITDYVQIGDITRSRLRDVKALFFVGVNDGIIPLSNGSGGIISDMDREYLKTSDIEVELAPTNREKAYSQRLYLYMLMSKPQEKLFISFSKLSEDGKSLRPSYLINTIKELFPGIVVENTENIDIYARACSEKAAFLEISEGLQPYISDMMNMAKHSESIKDVENILEAENNKEDQDIIKEERVNDIESILLEDKNLRNEIRNTSAYAASQHEIYKELIRIFAGSPEYHTELQQIVDMAFSYNVFKAQDNISKAVAQVLYGKNLIGSVTRLESFAKCAYQHFLQYGLNIKERELFNFEPRDMGSIFHDSLQVYSELVKENNENWFTITEEKSDVLVKDAVERSIAQGDYAAVYSSFRTTYMIERMKRITKRTVSVLTEQIRKGKFEPSKFEMKFTSANDCKALNIELSEDEKMKLIGRIDRLDVLEDEHNIYVKIIDYKSGNQDFDLAAIYEGTKLQLVLYLNAASEMLKKDKPVLPAGILYYHIDDPIVDADAGENSESINKKIAKELVMRGLVNSDKTIIDMMDSNFEGSSSVIPVSKNKDGSFGARSSVASTDEFKIISDYVDHTIKEMGRDILDGKTAFSGKNCDYCQYSSVCRYKEFATAEDNDKKLSRDEALNKMREKLGIEVEKKDIITGSDSDE